MINFRALLLAASIAVAGVAVAPAVTALPAEAVTICAFGKRAGSPTLYYDGGPVSPLKFRNSSTAYSLTSGQSMRFCASQLYVPARHNITVRCSNGWTYVIKGGSIFSGWKSIHAPNGEPPCQYGGGSSSARFNSSSQ